jgi:hypothetical protein
LSGTDEVPETGYEGHGIVAWCCEQSQFAHVFARLGQGVGKFKAVRKALQAAGVRRHRSSVGEKASMIHQSS